jgi:hypothetical protein
VAAAGIHPGIFFPLFWFIGAVLPPTRARYERV